MNQCPACKVSALPGAVFCNACGFRFQNAAAPPPPPMAIGPVPPDARRICPGCGAIAPTQRDHCSLCATPFGPMPLIIPARPDGAFWALVWECDFQCRGCGLKTPLDCLDTDGEVECRRCGMAQAFPVDQWEDGIALAHAVADLAGPAPPGSRAASVPSNSLTSVGIKDTCVESQESGLVIRAGGMHARTLRMRISTGSPLCRQCKAPLDVQVDASGQALTTCGRCQDRGRFALPPKATSIDPGIRAVLADEHRTDRPQVRVQASPGGGAVALNCPSCNASLPATAESTLVTCPYCRTACRIPARTLFKLTQSAPAPIPWWILFTGPSARRKELLQKAKADDDDDDDHIPQIRIDRRAARDHEAAQRSANVIGVLAALMAAGIGVGIFFYIQSTKKRADDASEQASKKGDDDLSKDDDSDKKGARGKGSSAKLTRDQFSDLNGCSCKVGSATHQLAVHVDAESSGTSAKGDPLGAGAATFDLSFILDSPTNPMLRLDGRGKAAPSQHVNGRGMAVGVGCDGDRFVVASKNAITAWSTKDGSMLWNAALESEFPFTGTPSKKGIGIDCSTLSVSKGVVRISLGGAKSAGFRMADGVKAP